MEEKNIPGYEQAYTEEERTLALSLINLEKAALDKWFQGDTSGYRELWSKKSFTYFDGVHLHRIENHEEVTEFLKTIEGKLYAESYDFCCPRAQFGHNMALLTYQLYAKTNLIDMRYNCVELYQKEDNGEWHVIHSTWSFKNPTNEDFKKPKIIV